ncbi:MAG: restriction endonuclease subunit S [Sideroxydans sp.]|nr:restriction endonuclease subunit S [Sideroxydans sp.]
MSKLTTARLPDVAELIMGQSPPGDTYNEAGNGLPFFQGKTEFGEVSPTPRKWCNAPKKIAEAGDILMSVRAPVGPTNLASTQCCIGRGLAAIRANPEKLDPSYLRFALRHAEPRLASMGQGSTFAAIGRAELAKIEFLLPPLTEQRRIEEILSRTEGIVRLRRDAEKKAAELIPALFLDMFGDPATNPKGWSVHLLKDLVSFMSGGTPSKSREDFWQGDLPWVSPKDMKQAYIVDAIDHVSRKVLSETNIKLVPIGSLLIVVRGMILVHTVPIAQSLIEHTINQDMKALLPVVEVNVGYLLWLMKVSQPQLLGLVTTAAHGTKKLDTERLENFRIPLPPLEIQASFVEKVAQIESILSQQSAATAKAQATFDALLAKAFASSE